MASQRWVQRLGTAMQLSWRTSETETQAVMPQAIQRQPLLCSPGHLASPVAQSAVEGQRSCCRPTRAVAGQFASRLPV